MTKKLLLVGSRKNLSDIVYTAKDLGYTITGILDKHYWGNTDFIDGVPVVGSEEELLSSNHKWHDHVFFLANWWDGSQDLSGNGLDGGALRQQRIKLLDQANVTVVNLIHPTAVFFHNQDTVSLGKGILILGHAKFTSHIQIGDYSVIDWDCNIGTETKIGRNVIVGATTTTAHALIGDNVRIGVGCIILPRKHDFTSIGDNSVVYVNSCVITDVPADSVYTMHDKVKRRVRTNK